VEETSNEKRTSIVPKSPPVPDPAIGNTADCRVIQIVLSCFVTPLGVSSMCSNLVSARAQAPYVLVKHATIETVVSEAFLGTFAARNCCLSVCEHS